MLDHAVSHKKKNPSQASFLSAIDKITLAYCAWFVVYMSIGIFLGRATNAQKHLPGHLLVAGIILAMAWAERNLDFTRNPMLLRALQFLRGSIQSCFSPIFMARFIRWRIVFPDWLIPGSWNWIIKSLVITHPCFGDKNTITGSLRKPSISPIFAIIP